MARVKTRYPGVYERVSATKMHKGKPDACYDVVYRVDGKLTWRKVGWKSEGYSPKLAADIRAGRVQDIRHGRELPDNKKTQPTFGEVAEKYLEWAKENKKSHYDDLLRYQSHLKPRLARKRINDISSFDLERLKSELLKQGLSPATVKHCLVIVRQVYNRASTWGIYTGPNPIKGVKLPALQNTRERFLSYGEAERLLEALKPDIRDMALLSLHAGLRASEIFSIKVHDVDLQHGLITILDPKNNQARKAHMTGAMREMLTKRTAERGPDDYIFTDSRGNPYKKVPADFRAVANKLFNENVKDPRHKIVFHSLRHSYASWLALEGESLLTIKELLGHKTIAMTMRYSHLLPDHKKAASLKIERAFNGKGREVEAVR